MSTLKVNKIENTATTDGGIEIDNTGHVQIDGLQLPTTGALSNRNKIINGDMRIDQRNAGSAVTVNTGPKTYTLDRWHANAQSSDGVFTVERSTTAPDSFTNSLLVTVTTADSSITSDQYYLLCQRIEGYNVADLDLGKSTAKSFTLSFWVRSSVTGTFSGSFENSAENRVYPYTYSISAADTWEQKTITVAGDTSGTWLTDNGIGLFVWFDLGTGTNKRGTAGSWADTSGGTYGVTGSTSLISTNGATFYITGVQLEVGSVATPFEHRSYGDELARCQRYYQERTYAGGGIVTTGISWSPNDATCNIPTNSKMRAAPTVELPTAGTGSNRLAFLTTGGSYPTTIGTHSATSISDTNITIYAASYAGLTDDGPSWVYAGSTGGSITFKFSAEL